MVRLSDCCCGANNNVERLSMKCDQKVQVRGKYSEVPHYIVLVFILAMIGGGIWNIVSNLKAFSATP